jgi:hypothetical protein
MTCSWCKGKGHLSLIHYGKIVCLNCKGIGKGKDGGDVIAAQERPWMIGNNNNPNRVNGRFAKKP